MEGSVPLGTYASHVVLGKGTTLVKSNKTCHKHYFLNLTLVFDLCLPKVPLSPQLDTALAVPANCALGRNIYLLITILLLMAMMVVVTKYEVEMVNDHGHGEEVDGSYMTIRATLSDSSTHNLVLVGEPKDLLTSLPLLTSLGRVTLPKRINF